MSGPAQLERAARQGRFLLQQYDRLLGGLDERHVGLEPFPGAKTAGWLLGHLAITGDYGRRLCGLAPLLPKEWRPLFAPGSQPARETAGYPSMAELVHGFRAVYLDLADKAAATAPETLAVPTVIELAKQAFPTAGEFVVYLLTGHLGYHLGQLSLWREAAMPGDPALRA